MMESNTSVSAQQDAPSLSIEASKKRRAIKIALIIVLAGIIVGGIFYLRSMLVAAVVDGTPISRFSVIRQLEKQGGRGVLDSLIAENLIRQEAAKKGITISDDEVNQDIKAIEAGIVAQGGTLAAALAQRGLTEEDVWNNIRIQKMVEKLLADKVKVTQDDINKFIADNKVAIPKGQEAQIKVQVENQLRNQKLSQEAQLWIAALRAKASITQYVSY